MDNQQLKAELDHLIHTLAEEMPKHQAHFASYPNETVHDKYEIYRGYCNIRPPKPVSEDFISRQDKVLQVLLADKQITTLEDLEPVRPQIYLWQGDITTLGTDAIVNAANSDMLGCTQANHDCIDNAIHTKAGVQLRLACHNFMTEQGRKEAMGQAKITKAYNLPSDYVIHTVGPYIDERGVSPIKEDLLRSSYRSCLKLAEENNLESIAFCCISTGEFHYPNEAAAKVAIQTVTDYLAATDSTLNVVFNVFLDKDREIYEQLLNQ